MDSKTLSSIVLAINHNADRVNQAAERYARVSRTLYALLDSAEASWSSSVATVYVADGRQLVGTVEATVRSLESALTVLRALGRTATILRTRLSHAEARLHAANSAAAQHASQFHLAGPPGSSLFDDLREGPERAHAGAANATREIEEIGQEWERTCSDAQVAIGEATVGIEALLHLHHRLSELLREAVRMAASVNKHWAHEVKQGADVAVALVVRPGWHQRQHRQAQHWAAERFNTHRLRLRNAVGQFARGQHPRWVAAKIKDEHFKMNPSKWEGKGVRGWLKAGTKPLSAVEGRTVTLKGLVGKTPKVPRGQITVGARVLPVGLSSSLRSIAHRAPVVGVALGGYAVVDAGISAGWRQAHKDADFVSATVGLAGSVLMMTPLMPVGAAMVAASMAIKPASDWLSGRFGS